MKNIERSPNSREHSMLRRNIEYALAAGFSTAFPLYLVMKSEAEEYRTGRLDADDFFLLVLLPSVYLMAAVLMWLCRNSSAGRKIPHWFGIAIIGSQLFMPLAFLHAAITIHGNLEFLTAERLLLGALLGLALSSYALMWTAVIRFSPSLIAALKMRVKKR